MSHYYCTCWESVSHKFEIKTLLLQELGRLSVNTLETRNGWNCTSELMFCNGKSIQERPVFATSE